MYINPSNDAKQQQPTKVVALAAEQGLPGSRSVGSATMLHEPPGILGEEVAAGQGDRGVVGIAEAFGDDAQFARPVHPASAGAAVQIEEDFTGDGASGAPVTHLPCGVQCASTDWGPSMFLQTTSVAQGATAVVGRCK